MKISGKVTAEKSRFMAPPVGRRTSARFYTLAGRRWHVLRPLLLPSATRRRTLPQGAGQGERMATKLKPVDAVTVGAGLTGTILAKELADSGLKVVGLERGGWRDTQPDFAMPYAHDELRSARRHELMQDLSRDPLTFRNGMNDLALPLRHMGSFLPGEGVGGAAGPRQGVTCRFLPWDFETRSRTLARYGASQLAEDGTSQDWGVTYNELETQFDRYENLYGICGKAGNLKGQIQEGGNPF